MCDRNIPTNLKDNVYKTAIKPAMVYGAECREVRKKEKKLHTTEMKCACCGRREESATSSCEKCRHLESGTHYTRWQNSSERRG